MPTRPLHSATAQGHARRCAALAGRGPRGAGAQAAASASAVWRPSPLVAALAAALPLLCSPPLEAATPPAKAVPVPAVTWRVSGSGAAAPVNTPNAQGGVNQVITQTSQRAVYAWQSFDIGATSSVHFDMPLTGGSALNRVTGSTAPSQIFGKLTASNNGEIYLINPNGILFGQGSSVNTGSLIASTLNLSDSEFNSGLTHHLIYDQKTPAFAYEGRPEDFVDSKNFVRVDPGASITTTGSGSRVFLFAKKVENAGTITAPDGQTVLAAGGTVYLQNPASNKLYASEANPDVPALRGLLVEVGDGPAGAPEGRSGTATNTATGVINTPRGNTTLVGMAVNQLGRIQATSSVTENGSIFLRAQGRALVDNVKAYASAAGDLVLGAGSVTTITADTQLNSDKSVPTTDGNATFVAPRIDLAGHTVALDTGAQVVAPGAAVYVRAEAVPNTDARGSVVYAGGDSTARVTIGDGAVIDVSGTTDAAVSVGRYFVTTALLGSNDLKDAPLQKDGLLYRSQATLDVRGDSKILGSLQSYRNTLQQTIAERLSAGGKVVLSAEGAVLTHANSRIDVSGGQVSVAAAEVRPTALIGSDGALYDLNTAPTDVTYSAATNLQRGSATQYDRFGPKVNYGNVSSTHLELGYTEGRGAGSLTVVAPTAVLGGTLKATVVAGDRQQTGLDSRATAGALSVGAVRQGNNDFSSAAYAGGPVLGSFEVSGAGPDAAALEILWADPLHANLGVASGMRASRLAESGFAKVAVAAEGDVALSGLGLADRGSLRLLSNTGEVALKGDVTAHAGSVELFSKTGSVAVDAGVKVDLAGRFVNQRLAGPQDTSATAGGSFSAKANQSLVLGAGTVVDVSGGAIVSASGTVTGANAGTIALNHTATTVGDTPGLSLQGELRGQSLATGGSLSIAAPQITLGGEGAEAPGGVLAVGPALFTQGGFSSFSVDGRIALDVSAGTTLAPTRNAWTVDPRLAALQASGGVVRYDTAGGSLAVEGSGGALKAIGNAGLPVGELPKPVSLSLASSGVPNQLAGALTVGEGAKIVMVDQSSLSLKAANRLSMLGEATSHGGSVSLSISNQLVDPTTDSTWLWLGDKSRIDVSGVAQITPTTDGLRTGKVLAGGSISLATGGESSYAGTVVVQEGAQLIAHGASAQLDQTVLTTSGKRTSRVAVDSAGGRISVASNGNLALEGQMDLSAGGASARGGALNVALLAGRDQGRTGSEQNLARELSLTSAQSHVTAGAAAGDAAVLSSLTGVAGVSADLVRGSAAADLSLSATETLRLQGSTSLNMAGALSLNSQALQADAGGIVRLEAAQVTLNAPSPRLDSGVPQPSAAAGDASVALVSRGGMVLGGHWVTSGIDQLSLQSAGDLMLQGITLTPNTLTGGLDTRADLTLSARQVYAASNTAFTIQAPDHAVRFTAGDRSAEQPLTAGSRLVVEAATIEQGGVLRLPQGQIALHATESLRLLDGSETSVSAAGLVLPYGQTSAGNWVTPAGAPLNALPTKRIDLAAPSVSVAPGAEANLSAGGDLLAYEFVAGKGGSTDVFAGGDGAFALVPGVHTAASYDTTLAGAAALGRQIEIGTGGPVAAGVYTLLPARYALQPGAFLVKPVSGSSTPFALGTAVQQADGSVFVGARLRTEGNDTASLPATWRFASQDVARKSSEIRSTSANTEFTRRASVAGTSLGERPVDAGTFSVAATSAALDGTILFEAATDSAAALAGRGGRAEFSAQAIRVSNGDTQAGVLNLSVAQLNALGAETVVLGGISGAATDAGTPLDVSASSIVFAQGAHALRVPDLVAVSTDRIDVQEHAVIFSAPAGSAVAPTRYLVEGDGAALRVSSTGGAELLRTGVIGAAGGLKAAADSRFNGGVAGTVVLDSTGTTQLASDIRLIADDVTLASRVVSVGGESNAAQLAITPALAATVAQASRLNLRAYTNIDFKEGAVLGSEALQQLVLDTPRLRVADATGPLGAQVVAGEITLTSTSGDATVANAGAGRLSLTASTAAGGSGLIRLADGQMVVNGASALSLDAERGVLISGQQRLGTAGDLTLRSALIGASQTAAEGQIVAGGALRLESNGQSATPVPLAVGATLDLRGERIDSTAQMALSSGAVTLQATQDVHLGSGARIDTAGQRLTMDGKFVDLGGGTVKITSESGNVSLDAGSRVDVSAGGAAAGGQLLLSAAQGAVQVGGELRGSSAAGAPGASLSIDSQNAVNLARLADQLAASGTVAADFTGALAYRQRQGGASVAAGTTLTAERIALSVDSGKLEVLGKLDARGADGGQIDLAAGGDLVLGAGSVLQASATATSGVGGSVALLSRSGSLSLQVGSTVNVSAGSGANSNAGGKLSLTASRTGVDASHVGGTDVAIDPLAGQILGARRVDVQGLRRVQVGDTLSAAEAASIAQRDLAFLGADGSQAEAMAVRLSAGQAGLQSGVRVHAATEAWSSGAMAVDTGGPWRLASAIEAIEGSGGQSAHVGDSSLTLRAAGNLTLNQGLSSGFSAGGVALRDGGSLSLVAGADLNGASALARRTDGQGLLTLGQAGGSTVVRTSTGELTLAAASSINMIQGDVSVLSTGVLSHDAGAERARGLGAVPDLAFSTDSGRVRLDAGLDISGRYLYRDTINSVSRAGHPDLWFSTVAGPDLRVWGVDSVGFQHGVASFGGGGIDVRAGRDAINLTLSAPSSGYWIDGEVSPTVRYGGGSVSMRAGRDVVNGVVQAGGRSLDVSAGRDIAFRPVNALVESDQRALTLAYEDTAVRLSARRDVSVGSVQSSFGLNGRWFSGLDANATLSAVASAGELQWRNGDELSLPDFSNGSNKLMMLPGQSLIAAPYGSVFFGGFSGSNGTVLQQPQTANASLAILAGQDLVMGDQLRVNASHISAAPQAYFSDTEVNDIIGFDGFLTRNDQGRLDGTTREPVRLLAQAGDLTFGSRFTSDRPVRVIAGRDMRWTSDLATTEIQHQASATGSELSLFKAGRDLLMNSAGLLIGGDGDLVLLAGRDIDLGIGNGVVANGNNDNSALQPQTSAAVTLVAGLRPDGADYAQAIGQGFQAAGAAAVTARAADVYALLTASGGAVPGLDSPAALAFKAQSLDTRLAQVGALLGAADYARAQAQYVRSLPGRASLGESEAKAAFAALSPELREAAVGQMLAARLPSVAAASRASFISQIAQADTKETAAAFVAWMKGQTGQTLSLATAISSFEALPLERQLIWLNKVLVDEVRTQGRAAVKAGSSAEQTLAYGRAYAAINTVFPIDRPDGSIRMPQSTLRTLQGGGVTLMALGGGVNAGESGGSFKGANELGIVTVAGGDISALVRDDFLVNQSRVFTLAKGDVLLWSSAGDIDAGRGGKTVVGAPAPVYKLDDQGRVVVDTSGSFSGSGIAVLDAKSSLDLYAPAGAIDAGEAGIRATGNVVLGAEVVRGADDIKGGNVQGAPVVASNAASVSGLSNSADASATRGAESEEERKRKRRNRRQLLLEFLGFGRA